MVCIATSSALTRSAPSVSLYMSGTGMSHTQRCRSGRCVAFDFLSLIRRRGINLSVFPKFTKDKKDVTLTYVMKPPSKEVQFEDIVEYRAATAAATASPSRITGVDTLIAPASAAHTPAGQHAQTRFKWRGRGWLVVATSRWQVLGCSADVSAENPHAWAVTYFEKTLFTPPGLDVYARTAAGLPEALVEEIVRKAVALGGDVGVLARAFFEVERSGVERKSGVCSCVFLGFFAGARVAAAFARLGMFGGSRG